MVWVEKKFYELTLDEVYEIYHARIQTFVIEQQCNYQDIDKHDKEAIHLFCEEADEIIAYCRIYCVEDKVKIGRVLVLLQKRGRGLATEMMQKAIQIASQRFPNKSLYVQAQSYLEKFYTSLGFKTISDVYMEVSIPHIDMKYVGN